MSLSLDPRTKLFLLVFVSILINFNFPYVVILGLVFIAVVILALNKKFVSILKIAAVVTGFILLNQLCMLLPQFLKNLWTLLYLGFYYFYPFIIYAFMLQVTTSVSEICIALQKMKAPAGLSITIAVIFRFFPTITREARQISNAMKLRGLSFGLKSIITKPVKTMEFMYVPLLYSMVKTSDELTVAALTRGLGLYKERSYIKDIGFSAVDIITVGIFFVLVIVGVYLKRGL